LLELRGIRSATDLLKAWPDPSADATRDVVPGQPTTLPGIVGLPAAETGMLVRVLQQDTRLAPVWNWQQRGVTVHEEVRAAALPAAARQTSMAS
jgi:hypothetical protein